MSTLSIPKVPSAPAYVNCENSPIFELMPPARKPLSSCGNAAAPFWVSGSASSCASCRRSPSPESSENGDRLSRPPLVESFSSSVGRLVRVYPFSLNFRPNGVSVRN